MYIDNGSGSFIGLPDSSFNYSTGETTIPSFFNLQLQNPIWALWPDNTLIGVRKDRYYFTGWGSPDTVPSYIAPDCIAKVDYLYGDPLSVVTETFTAEEIRIDLTPGATEKTVPGSVLFDYLGHEISDKAGVLIADNDPATGAGTAVGVIDYELSQARVTAWSTGTNQPLLKALRTSQGKDLTDAWTGRAPAIPIKSLSFTIRATRPDGTSLSASADVSGIISATGVEGTFNYQTGIYDVRFGRWVDDVSNRAQPWYSSQNVIGTQVWQPLPVFSSTIQIDGVAVTRTALSQSVTGIDTSRLPPSGQLYKFAPGDKFALHHTAEISVDSPTPGATLSMGRTDLDWIWVRDADGKLVPRDQFVCTESDLAAGNLHWAASLNTTASPLPWTVFHRIWFMDVIDDRDQWGRIVIANKAVNRTFPVGSHVSALLVAGDIQAKVGVPFFQKVWTGVWSQSLVGDAAEWAYDYLDYPVQVTNRGCTIKALVALEIQTVTSSDVTYKCIVQGFGVIAQGISIHSDFAPNNPATGAPIFTVLGNNSSRTPWGVGHTVGSAMIFQLSPSTYPAKLLKTLMPSIPTGLADEFEFEFRGSINRP